MRLCAWLLLSYRELLVRMSPFLTESCVTLVPKLFNGYILSLLNTPNKLWKAGIYLIGNYRNTVVVRRHYIDVIMSAIASQITSLTIVYSTVYSGTDERKHQSFASLAFVRGIHRWIPPPPPPQRPSNAKIVSIWWHLHGLALFILK